MSVETAKLYTGKVAVVTGGGSGLGAAMADRFAAEGAAIALIDIDGPRGEAKAAELRAAGTDAIAIQADVAEKDSVAAAAATIGARLRRCDILCANVGVQQFGAIDRLTEHDWQWVMSVNFHGIVQTVAAFLPMLRQVEGRRHVVITSSASYFQHGQRMAAYVASKFAVTGYAEVLRAELAQEGIEVSILFPAGMMTRHIESSIAARPAVFGESRFDREDVEAMIAGSKIQPADILDPSAAVRNLIAELEAGEAYIFTHGSYRNQIEERAAAVLAGFDRTTARADHTVGAPLVNGDLTAAGRPVA